MAGLEVEGNIYLSGIRVDGVASPDYAPLLINKIGSYTDINIKNVSNTENNTSGTAAYSSDQKVASSLIGDAGSSNATNINITFSAIKLDGRKTSKSGYYDLDSVYNTTSSLFNKATLLNSLRYSSGSCSYDYNIDEVQIPLPERVLRALLTALR